MTIERGGDESDNDDDDDGQKVAAVARGIVVVKRRLTNSCCSSSGGIIRLVASSSPEGGRGSGSSGGRHARGTPASRRLRCVIEYQHFWSLSCPTPSSRLSTKTSTTRDILQWTMLTMMEDDKESDGG